MRQAGTLPTEAEANRFADFLSTQGIQNRVEGQAETWGVWVLDEDRLPEAQAELEAFRNNPAEPRFAVERKKVEQARRQTERPPVQLPTRPRPGRASGASQRPLTWLLIATSVIVTVWLSLPGYEESVRVLLSIAPYRIRGNEVSWEYLSAIREGQIWRLVTPIFLHAALLEGIGALHLLFNVFWLHELGGQVEDRRGIWRFGLLVLVLAVASNLAEYWWSRHPLFGGMSGVNYGLLGYIWIKTRYRPAMGFFLAPGTMLMMMVWLVACMTGMLGPVANAAHAAGLVLGVAIGYAPVAFSRRR